MRVDKHHIIDALAYLGLATLICLSLVIQSSSPMFSDFYYLIFYLVVIIPTVEFLGLRGGVAVTLLTILLQALRGNIFLAVTILFISGYQLLVKKFSRNKLALVSNRERHFRQLVNFSQQPLVLMEKDSEVIFVGKSLKKVLGLSGLAVGRNFVTLIFPDDAKAYEMFLKDIVDSPFEGKSIEIRLSQNDKDIIWVQINSINLLNHPDVKAIVFSLQDITSQKQLDTIKEESFKQESQARSLAELAVRQRDEFLSVASHELKTPLTTILLQLQATLRRTLTQSLADFSGAELLKSIQIAEKQSQRLAMLIKDLLNVSIASTGRITLNKEKMDLVELTGSLIDRYQEEIRLSKSNVKFHTDVTKLIGYWDPIRIEQTISNLIMNAIKYSDRLHVSIRVRKVDNWAIVTVSDKGVGISPADLATIFEPFKRANREKGVDGLGVGLFIAKQIVTAHGGDIRVESKPNEGSTFGLWLPLPSTQTAV